MIEEPKELSADEYITLYSPRFRDISLDYSQCLRELAVEASEIAKREGVASENGKYPPWIWDKVFGD